MAPPDPDPREKLLGLSREREVSLASLSDMIGRNSSYLHQFITRGSPRRLGESDRRTLAEFFGIEETALGATKDNSHNRHPSGLASGDWARIPRLSLGASAGPGVMPAEEAPMDSFRFSRRWLREQGLDGSKLSAIAVEGDSMEPLLRNGDEILVDRTERPFRDGVHVVRLGDALLVKRIASLGFGRYTLLSENKAYPPLDVAADEIEIIGRVVWKAGRV